jgi:glycosyltransferase involved in cell wall biosynthesis
VTVETLPQITTVIPTFRRPGTLHRSIRSVLNQTYPHFRVCVYDDISGDGTAAAVSEAAQGDPRVHYYCNPERLGIARNFRHGMERVETPYFSFLSDDDVLLPEFYQQALEGFHKFPEAGFSALSVVLMKLDDQLGVAASDAWPEGLCRPPHGLRNMLTMYPPLWTAILFRRELIEKVGLLDAEVGNGCDIDFTMRVLAHYPMVFSHRPGGLGVAHAGAATARTRMEDVWPGMMKLIRNTVDDARLDPQLREMASRILTRALKRKLFVDCGLYAIIQDRGDEARRSAAVLSRELAEPGRGGILRCIDGAHRIFPPLRRISVAALALYRRRAKRRSKRLIQQQAECFRTYRDYLKLDVGGHDGTAL